MDKQHFDQLVKGVRDMKCHMAGKAVRGVVVTNVGAPDGSLNAEVKVKAIRETALTSQSQFAKLIGVNLRTPQI